MHCLGLQQLTTLFQRHHSFIYVFVSVPDEQGEQEVRTLGRAL